jgi:protein FAM32A
MPADEYSSVVRGGLKLKGSAPSGISKKKKKDKKKPKEAADGEKRESKNDALRKALEDEDEAIVRARDKGEGGGEEEGDRELEVRGNDGKTASERAYEEMRRRRVSCSLSFFELRGTGRGGEGQRLIGNSYMSACRKRASRRIRRRWRS